MLDRHRCTTVEKPVVLSIYGSRYNHVAATHSSGRLRVVSQVGVM